jgi:23S rRNA pseudouridine2605 synthase
VSKLQTSRRIGLARALSKLGYCSRSRASELIRAGRVSLNSKIRRDPEQTVNLPHDRIQVDGHRVCEQKKIYLMLNKPRGIVTTASDEHGRDTIYSLLDDSLPWLGAVGRLDKASEGLLLLSNDSEWAARLTDPKAHVDKIYHVQINAVADESLLEALRRGVSDRGEFLQAKQVRILRGGERNTWLEIVLDEGKNRQIRRMLAHFHLDVLRLIRVAIGPLALGSLAKGKTRLLTKNEKAALDALFHQNPSGRNRHFPRNLS